MLKIRLRRQGAKRQPFYRIVVAEADFKRDGRFLEVIGQYNPRTEPGYFLVEEARALHYLSNGAQPTDAVRRILGWSGTLDRFARLKAGEPLETLVAEAEAAAADRTWDLRTRRDDLAEIRAKAAAEKAAEKAAADKAAAEKAAAEAAAAEKAAEKAAAAAAKAAAKAEAAAAPAEVEAEAEVVAEAEVAPEPEAEPEPEAAEEEAAKED